MLERLNEAINASGYKRKYLADSLGIKYDTFRRKLNGENQFKLDELVKLCNILNIKITSLFDENNKLNGGI